MRLLSFLTAIENALQAESPALEGGAWESNRMVNFHHGLARLTLTPRPGNAMPAGAIFLQEFILADGSLCLKASLNWKGRDAFPTLAVYSTPQLNWKLEASRVASTWVEGPREIVTSASEELGLRPLAAAVG
jgi:hypothetical protein